MTHIWDCIFCDPRHGFGTLVQEKNMIASVKNVYVRNPGQNDKYLLQSVVPR